MQYAILICEPDSELDKRGDPDRHGPYMAPYEAYMDQLREAGILRGGEILRHPATATTVKIRDGVRHIQDGPFAHSREQLGGFIFIEVPDLDAALEWAARCPAARTGLVEVRPCGMESPG